MPSSHDPITGEALSRSDLLLAGRAARERWPMDDIYRVATAKRMIAIALNPKEKASDAVSAARVLATLDRLNLDEARLDWERRRGMRIDDLPDPNYDDLMAEEMRSAALRRAEQLQLENHATASRPAPESSA